MTPQEWVDGTQHRSWRRTWCSRGRTLACLHGEQTSSLPGPPGSRNSVSCLTSLPWRWVPKTTTKGRCLFKQHKEAAFVTNCIFLPGHIICYQRGQVCIPACACMCVCVRWGTPKCPFRSLHITHTRNSFTVPSNTSNINHQNHGLKCVFLVWATSFSRKFWLGSELTLQETQMWSFEVVFSLPMVSVLMLLEENS